MGGQPRFFLSRSKPTQQDFQSFFPGAMSGDYVMSYPVDQYMQSPSAEMSPAHLQPFSSPHPVVPQLSTEGINMDDQFMDLGMDWTAQQQDDMWEMRLGDASVDQISQFPVGAPPAPLMQMPNMPFQQHLSPGQIDYTDFNQDFQQTPAPGIPSPEAFSVPLSAISSPPHQTSTYSSFGGTPDIHFSEHASAAVTPGSLSQPNGGSCCGGSNGYSPNDMDMFDVTLPNIPLSPIPSPRMVQTGPST